MSQPLRFSGVMPANVLPFTADLAIDEPAYRRHLRWLADTRGVTGIVANGHASRGLVAQPRGAQALAGHRARRGRPARARSSPASTPTVRRRRSSWRATRGPPARPACWSSRPRCSCGAPSSSRTWCVRHFSEIAAGADLPIVVFEYPPASGIGYAPETLATAGRDSAGRGGEGLVERDRGVRGESASAARHRPPGGDALGVHDVADGDLPARRRRRDLGHGQRHRRSPGRAVRGVRQGRSGRRPTDQRPARAAGVASSTRRPSWTCTTG